MLLFRRIPNILVNQDFRSLFRRIGYEVKLSYPTNLIILLFPLFAFVIYSQAPGDAQSKQQNTLIIFEVVFPILAAFTASSMIVYQQEVASLEYLAVRQSLSKVWAFRSLLQLAWIAFVLVLVVWGHNAFYFEVNITAILITAAAPAAGLIALANLAALIFIDTQVGLVLASAWWAFCLLFSQAAYQIIGSNLFLFPSLFGFNQGLLANKIYLLGVAVGMFVLCLYLLKRTARLFP
ncbi:MAG: hypothetical protein OEZ02_06750 [Anaerolineae bacterium]|nr:hypothetical protein [Anaerolineae bacterium]